MQLTAKYHTIGGVKMELLMKDWNQLRRKRNYCLSFTLLTGIIGIIGILSDIEEPVWTGLKFGTRLALVFYACAIVIGLGISLFYQFKMRKISKIIQGKR